VELQPSSAEVHCNLGSALFASGDSDGAIAELHRAITLDPQYAPAYCDLGTVLATRGDSDGAIAQWRKALAIRPEYTEAHGALGDALYARGEVAEAVDQWREAIRLQPGDEVRLRQTAWVLATNPQAQVRNGTEAVTLAVRAVNLSAGKDPAALDTLAAAYAETGQFESAIATERRALAVAAERRLETIDATEAMTARSHLYESGKPFRTAAALAW